MNIFKLALWKKIIIGMVGGILVGSIWGEYSTYLQPVGTLFITAVQMLIVPLVFFSLVSAMTAVPDLKKMGRIGGKSVIFYLLTSIAAVVIGLVLATMLHPGINFQVIGGLANADQVVNTVSILDTLLSIVPSNPINALASGNILQILLFAIIFGLSINLVGKEGQVLIPVFRAGASVMFRLTSLVMELAPYGIFALMANLAGSYGLGSLLPLLKLIIVIYFGYLLLVLVVYVPIIWFVVGLSPMRFFKKLIDVIVVAFTTSSSSATLPISMFCAENRLGISKAVTSFVLPLGATVNMNGTALYQGVAALFIAQVYGVDLTLSQAMVVILTSLLGAIGTAGVPGAGVIMLSIVLNAVGLPLEGIGIILAVDRIVDMGRSALNVTGDLIAAMVVAKVEREVDFNIINKSNDLTFKNRRQGKVLS